EKLLSTNIVLDLSGMLVQEQVFLIRLIFELLHVRTLAGARLGRPLLFILDEGQVIAGQGNFSQKMLGLRHLGVRFIGGFQNFSVVPVELAGNCDFFVSFQATDDADRKAFGSVARMTREQMDHLATLKPGEAVAYLPRSDWKRPFLANVPRVT